MEIGLGLDATLGLSYDDQGQISALAAGMGYESIWTPETGADDAFQLCALRWRATTGIVAGGLSTGIGVSPVGLRTPMGLAMSAGTLSKMSGGRFVLGVGTGSAYTPEYRRTWGLKGRSSLALMRDYLTTMRGLLAGESVTYEGQFVSLQGAKLGIEPAQRTPIYLGALGPEMVRLGGEYADGLCLNWCTAEQVAWSRERAAEGAVQAGRDPSAVKVAEYIRICVDDDVDAARRAFTRAVMGYAMGRAGESGGRPQGYRAHFGRMGFEDDLSRLEAMRANGASQGELVEAFPDALLREVGYYGPAAGAAAAFRRLAEGLDVAIVRVVAARPGIDATRAVMEACKPVLVRAG